MPLCMIDKDKGGSCHVYESCDPQSPAGPHCDHCYKFYAAWFGLNAEEAAEDRELWLKAERLWQEIEETEWPHNKKGKPDSPRRDKLVQEWLDVGNRRLAIVWQARERQN